MTRCMYCNRETHSEKNFCNSHCQGLYDIKTGEYISIWKDSKSPIAKSKEVNTDEG